VVKQLKAGAAPGFTDWASLAFLSTLPGATGVAPRFYGGDAAHRFFVMEDLGGSRSLQDVLMGNDRRPVDTALRRLSRQYARLHAATLGNKGQYHRILEALPESGHRGRHAEARRWLTALARVHRWAQRTGCALPAGFDRACGQLAAAYAEPGPWLAFTHGDPAPTNNHVADDGVRLLDFEYGGFRHALYDLTAWYVLCPLPDALVRAMSRWYRRALATGCAAARNPQDYRRAWGAMAAYRALAILTWIPESALDADRPWVEGWSARAAVLTAVSRLHEAAALLPELQPIGAAAGNLRDTLRGSWPEVDGRGPRWPALRTRG
jgi:thiamine kinase-like enzyme